MTECRTSLLSRERITRLTLAAGSVPGVIKPAVRKPEAEPPPEVCGLEPGKEPGPRNGRKPPLVGRAGSAGVEGRALKG